MSDERREIKVVDLNASMELSWARVQELKAGRDEGNIPLFDEYWKALKKHRAAFQKGTLK